MIFLFSSGNLKILFVIRFKICYDFPNKGRLINKQTKQTDQQSGVFLKFQTLKKNRIFLSFARSIEMTSSRPVLATPAFLLLILFTTELASCYEQKSNLNKADMALSANTATEPLQGPSTRSVDYTGDDNTNKTTTLTDITVVNNMSITSKFEIPTDKTFIFMSIVYSISTLSAIVSNLIVILVYLFVQKTKTDLSIFLINLAVADFLAGTFCMPFSFAQVLLKKWIFGDTLCTLGKQPLQ